MQGMISEVSRESSSSIAAIVADWVRVNVSWLFPLLKYTFQTQHSHDDIGSDDYFTIA
jgi:hypothetical protein